MKTEKTQGLNKPDPAGSPTVDPTPEANGKVATFNELGVARPSPETVQILRDIQSEISAGMVLKLAGFTEPEQAWNNASERANKIIDNYAEGYGLFQMTRRARGRETPAPTTHQRQPGTGSSSATARARSK